MSELKSECGYPKFCENCERDAYGEPVNGCIIDNKMNELEAENAELNDKLDHIRETHPYDIVFTFTDNEYDEMQREKRELKASIAALEAAAHVHTCRVVASLTENLTQPELTRKWYELSCGHSLIMQGLVKPSFCATCGAEVVGGV